MASDETVRSHQQLQVWQIAMDVAEDVYRATEGFPKHQQYVLCSQLQRACVSIPSNIAEGHARDSTREYLYHVSVALGSTAELETQLILSARLGFMSESKLDPLMARIDRMGRMAGGLQRALKAKL